jgi:hypothetical protein
MYKNLLYSAIIVLSLFSCKDDSIVEEVPPVVEDLSRIEAFLTQNWTIESFFSKADYISIPWSNQANYVVYRHIITNKQDVLSNSVDQSVMVLSIDSLDKSKGMIERYVWITQEPIEYHVYGSLYDYSEMMDFFLEQIMDKKIFRICEYLKIESDIIKNQVFLKTERTTIEEYTTHLFWKENINFVLPKAANNPNPICVKLPIEIGNSEIPVTTFKSDDLLFKVKTN